MTFNFSFYFILFLLIFLFHFYYFFSLIAFISFFFTRYFSKRGVSVVTWPVFLLLFTYFFLFYIGESVREMRCFYMSPTDPLVFLAYRSRSSIGEQGYD